MEQRLRLVQGSNIDRHEKRAAVRHKVAVPGSIVWKDAKGSTKMASVVTRDVSETGVRVEVVQGAAIPLYRMVYFHIDRSVRNRTELPVPLQSSHVLSAVFRVGTCSEQTGAPAEYALRLLVEPRYATATAAQTESPAAVLSA